MLLSEYLFTPGVGERVPGAPELGTEEVVELVRVAHPLPVRPVQVDLA